MRKAGWIILTASALICLAGCAKGSADGAKLTVTPAIQLGTAQNQPSGTGVGQSDTQLTGAPTNAASAGTAPTGIAPTGTAPAGTASTGTAPTGTAPTVTTPTGAASAGSTAANTPTPAPTKTPTGVPEATQGDISFSVVSHYISGNTTVKTAITTGKSGYITYTLDGTEPTKKSERADNGIPITVGGTSFPNCFTIRAKAWYQDGSASETCVYTYFASETIATRFTTYILSINGNPQELTEGPNGILYGENAKNRGREYERAVHLELISREGETVFLQHAGIRAYGGKSRERLPIKPMKIYARKTYGKGSFSFDGFGSTTLDGTEPIVKYDKLVLRNGGDDFQQTNLREELVHCLAAEIGFDTYEAVVPVVVYMNGSYYGLYWMHESYCDEYFQRRNGKSNGEYVVAEGSDRKKTVSDDETKAAAAKEYNEIYKKYSTADLCNNKLFNELCKVVDVQNYLDYMSYNLYISNYDWPERNFKCFRYYANDGVYGEGEMDGRWRFLIHDADVSFACYDTKSEMAGATRKDLVTVITDTSHERYSPMLAALLRREDCTQYFIGRMEYYMTEAVTVETVGRILQELRSMRDGELPYYFERLEQVKKQGAEIWASASYTDKSLAALETFTRIRPENIRQQLKLLFGYEGPK